MDLRSCDPFRIADATTLHRLSRHAVASAISRGDLVMLGVGIVVGAGRLAVDDPADVHAAYVEAALLRMRGIAAGSHGSAAQLLGIDRLGRHSGQVRLTRGGGRYRRLDIDARLHVAGLPAEHITTARGALVTTPARTVIDIARLSTFRSGVVTADSALRRGCAPEELRAVLDFCRHWPGRRRAVDVCAFADGRAESPLESVSRVFMRDWDLPEPELQHSIYDGDDFVGRVDFYWPEHQVVGEADGLLKYDDPSAGRLEKLREMRLEDLDYEVVRWTWDEIWRHPEQVHARIQRAFRRAGRRRVA